MSLRRRLDKIEGYAAPAPCPECGRVPRRPGELVTFRFAERGENAGVPETCPSCGELNWFTFHIGNADDDDEVPA